MDIFVPRWTKYITVLRKKHSTKITDPLTGQKRFPKLPTITPALWKLVQKFDVARFLVSQLDANRERRTHWEKVNAFFAERIIAVSDASERPSMVQVIQLFHEAHPSIGMARTTSKGFVMPGPSAFMMHHVRRKDKTQGATDEELSRLDNHWRKRSVPSAVLCTAY